MEALYHQTNKEIQDIQHCFQQLSGPGADALAIENEILTRIQTVNA